jgi:hypothetical protein
MLLDLATVKLHLRVDDAAEDALIGIYVTAAEEFAMQFLGRTIYEDEAAQGTDTDGVVINPAIQAALLLIVGHLYANREDVLAGVSVAQLPHGSQYLLMPYRVGMGI